MILSNVRSRQPLREVWTCKRLIRECAIALGQAVDNSTWKNYGSALNSYLNFIKMHKYPLEPSPDTLSLFTIYMCHHIKPDCGNLLIRYLPPAGALLPQCPHLLQLCSGTLYIAGLQENSCNSHVTQASIDHRGSQNCHQCAIDIHRL